MPPARPDPPIAAKRPPINAKLPLRTPATTYGLWRRTVPDHAELERHLFAELVGVRKRAQLHKLTIRTFSKDSLVRWSRRPCTAWPLRPAKSLLSIARAWINVR